MDCEARIAVVTAFMVCINRGDHEGALVHLHPDICVDEPTQLPYAGRWVGHAQFLLMMRSAMTIWQTWRDTPYPYELACVGDRVFRQHEFRAEVRGSGAVVEMSFLEVAEFRDEKIAAIRPYYFDPQELAAAVGTRE